MRKQIFILNSKSGNAGVAKILHTSNASRLILQLNNFVSGKNKCYALINNKVIELGKINKKNETYNFDYPLIIDKIFIAPDMASEPYAWSGEKTDYNVSAKKSSNNTEPLSEYFTFDNFFGGGFEWRRIRGNFIIFDYSIIHHILSSNNVYPAINRAGYYCAGIREDEDITLIAILIPKIKGIINPFSSLSADIYTVKSGKLEYSAVCIGIDKTGEFFLSI